MKKITLLITLMITSLGFAQQVLIQDFEAGGLAGVFGSAAAALAPNPSGSSQVAMLSSSPAGTVWQGTNISLTQNVRLTTDKTMSMDVYSTTPITIAPKVLGGLAGAPASTTKVQHTGTGWETLTFTFNLGLDGTTTANGDYSAFVIYYNWNTAANNFGTQDSRVFYVDNIKGIGVAPPVDPVPSVAAPTPPARNPADVISLYSDAYTNITINDWSAGLGWNGKAPITDLTLAGNNTKKIAFGDFIGVDFGAGNHIDATAMTTFHMDFWIPGTTDLSGKVLSPKLSQWGGTAGEVSSLLLTYTPTVNGTWASIDAPVSTFAGSQTRNDIAQFLISSNLGLVYVDNIYIYKGTALGVQKFDASSLKMYPNPVKNTLTIDANSAIQRVSVYNILGQEVLKASPKINSVTLQTSELQKGVYMVTTEIDGKVSTLKVVKE
ncbi:MAG: T9SS type A sorting domain-containing protein [Flavobacteriaceae bacterium]|nr:T9SS type A sorting domain-containing protein [Flavobacteriaceae bacterium]